MRPILYLALFTLSSSGFALESFFCAQGNGIVRLGMTTEEVRKACGAPQDMLTDTSRIVKKQPVTRLTFSNLSQGPVYYWDLNKVYHIFSIPSNQSDSSISFDIVDNKVKNVYLNGNSINGTSACNYKGTTQFVSSSSPTNNITISVGDTVDKVYAACGNPDYQNDTYIDIPVPKNDKPELWTYKLDIYNPSYKLTFIQGTLQNIEKGN